VLDKTSPSVIVVNSKFSYDAINACFKKKAILVYPPVNLHRICDLINVKKRNNVVLVYSQYTLTQNLQIVPKIAKYVQKGDFAIFGPYGAEASKTINTLYRSANNLLVRKRVKILVDQPFQRFKDLLFEAKVFLRTLPYEPFGISVVEAMATGCVPVVPRCGGPWFDILDCKQGVYGFSYGSIGEAAEIINRLLEDDVLRESVASRARERALMFDSSIFEKKILDVVDKVYRFKGEK
jgi:glycosyltransferase involved in cell wall biosynthesis